MKRAFDIVAATVSLAVGWPMLVIAALAIKLDSPGPVLFRQTRVGRHGTHFELLKFRSMVIDAPLLGGHSTMRGDPRITRVGRFLRRTSIDELPQLLNVLRGEMSIVGPRPNVPAQEAEYSADDWRKRASVKPGITGLAQIHGRSDATQEERLRWDLAYADDNDIKTDLTICLLTARQLLRGGTN